MDELKKQAEELGIKVDGRWNADRLQAEIDEKLAAEPEPIPEADIDLEPETQEDDPETVDEPEAPTDPVQPEQGADDEPLLSAEEMADIEQADRMALNEHFVTVTNLQANPMRSLGLASYGSAEFSERQLATDPRLVARIQRGEELGLLKVDE